MKNKKLIITKFKNKKIELAPIDNINQYEKEIGVILNLLGHPEALVTDESSIWEFLSNFDDKKSNRKYNNKILNKISRRLGIDVKSGDLLIDIAKKIRI